MFTEKDVHLIAEKGIRSEVIGKQIENFKKGFPFIELKAAATNGNGLLSFDNEKVEAFIRYFDKHVPEYSLLKFVPASGAASRMFKHLFEFTDWYRGSREDIRKLESIKRFNSVYYLIHNIRRIAFYDTLKDALKKDGFNIDNLIERKQYHIIIEYIIGEKGLSYGKKPKALIEFHQYPEGSRFALEEHLVEGALYARDKNNRVKLHFTVSNEHLENFQTTVQQLRGKYEKKFSVNFEIEYSEQKPSTDTIAVEIDNSLFRDEDDRLLFRPGGHGALIENLNELGEEIIFIKNIDNIVPDRLKKHTVDYKKVIASVLLQTRQKVFRVLDLLENKSISEEQLNACIKVYADDLGLGSEADFEEYTHEEKRLALYKELNRPVRVCGMVKNEGEPGGGPFWVKDNRGKNSLQIVETSQINLDDMEQQAIVKHATHFNPVDIVCAIRNHKGEKFNLKEFVDPDTGFISIKSNNGRKLKAQELPGLWNGAMAYWITLFVEVPIVTFNPVKTVNDLLRENHLPE